MNALKLLANQQKDGDSPVKIQYKALLREKSAQNRAQSFIMVDNHEAVKDGDSEKNMESRKVVKPKFTTDFLDAMVREGADELTLRAVKEGMLRTFIDTTDAGDNGWEPPLGYEDWHAIFAKVSRDQNGKPCTRSCTKRSNVRNLKKTRRSRRLCLRKRQKTIE